MLIIWKQLLCMLLILLGIQNSYSQHRQALIYGEIVLKNGTIYAGHIRWRADGEATWDDVFNASKYDLPIQTTLSKEEAKRLTSSSSEGFRLDFMALWENPKPNRNFAFKCNFGDIEFIDLTNPDIPIISLKNGHQIRLKTSASSDLGGKKIIYEKNLGTLTFNWKDIHQIRFKPAPENSRHLGGRPIYGEVSTTDGIYKGYISWDLEECLAKDLISGYDKGVKVDLYFRDIKEIRAENNGSTLFLNSGKAIFLNNHDDVGKGNHGILIRDLSFGKVIISWEDFISVRFLPSPNPPLTYDDFPPAHPISGTVLLKSGQKYNGRLIYDQDETLDVEFLDGNNDGFTFYIPFREVEKIVPQNYQYSLVVLRNGEQKILGEHPDITNNNNGIIVISPNFDSKLIPWEDIKEVVFDEME